jgi:multidrug efflux pump
MLYFSSSSSSAGNSRIKITFSQEVNADIAQVQVQNKVNQILSRLPEDVQRQGVRVFKSQSDFLMMASVYDSTGLADKTDISDFLVSNLQDSISRIEGVGDVQVFGGSIKALKNVTGIGKNSKVFSIFDKYGTKTVKTIEDVVGLIGG